MPEPDGMTRVAVDASENRCQRQTTADVDVRRQLFSDDSWPGDPVIASLFFFLADKQQMVSDYCQVSNSSPTFHPKMVKMQKVELLELGWLLEQEYSGTKRIG